MNCIYIIIMKRRISLSESNRKRLLSTYTINIIAQMKLCSAYCISRIRWHSYIIGVRYSYNYGQKLTIGVRVENLNTVDIYYADYTYLETTVWRRDCPLGARTPILNLCPTSHGSLRSVRVKLEKFCPKQRWVQSLVVYKYNNNDGFLESEG